MGRTAGVRPHYVQSFLLPTVGEGGPEVCTEVRSESDSGVQGTGSSLPEIRAKETGVV